MYTISIIVLCLISGFLIVADTKLYKSKSFLFWFIASNLTGLTEFVCFLRYKAWQFSPSHVIGFQILGVEIEDIFFCFSFSIIFYKLYHVTKKIYKQRVFNPSDKMIFAIILMWFLLINFDVGSLFSKYMAMRLGLSMIGLVYCFNYSSFRHASLFIFIVFCIAIIWDIAAISCGHWYYISKLNNIPVCYDGMWFSILKAKFPIEMPFYYISGASYSFWTLAFFDKYFHRQRAI